MNKLLDSVAGNSVIWSLFRVVKRAPGVRLLAQPVANRLFPRERQVQAKIKLGLTKNMVIQANPRYHRDYMRGDPEPWFEELLRDSLGHGDFFVDVGAHIGFFVLYAAQLVGREGRILALEPDRENFATLKANIELNRLRGVEALMVAAWSSSSPVYFKMSGMASGRVDGKVVGESGKSANPAGDPSRVDAASLDDVVDGLPTLVKIDVEGAEVEVLRGATRLLSACVTIWAVECHSLEIAQAVDDMFRSLGYAISRRSPLGSDPQAFIRVFVVARPTLQVSAR